VGRGGHGAAADLEPALHAASEASLDLAADLAGEPVSMDGRSERQMRDVAAECERGTPETVQAVRRSAAAARVATPPKTAVSPPSTVIVAPCT